MRGAESPPMVRLLDRGRESRRGVIKCLMDTPSQTEEEVVASTGLSKSTVRNALQLLLRTELATSKRRKRDDGRRGPGPIEYWLTTASRSPEQVESELRTLAGGIEGEDGGTEVHHVGAKTLRIPPQQREVFVIVKAGTNDAVLTKDGRMLRVEEPVLGKVLEQYRRVLRGVELETMRLDDYYARFYPDLKGKGAQRPVF